ncbi:MAG: hypothetical protein RJB66_215 [Pseudomonadota bacterium]
MKYWVIISLIFVNAFAEAKISRRWKQRGGKATYSRNWKSNYSSPSRDVPQIKCDLPATSATGPVPSEVESSLKNLVAQAKSMGISPTAVRDTTNYYRENYARLKNKCYFSIVDFNIVDTKNRFFIFDVKNGSIEAIKTSQGRGSDKNNDGFADSFSNKSGSNASSLGFYETDTTYKGKHGVSLKLDGKSPGLNTNAKSRAVVIHSAAYVRGGGRSQGCFALEENNLREVIGKLKNGALIYAYHRSLSNNDLNNQYAQADTEGNTGTL